MPVAKSGNKRKITIKAFAKPPKLPPDFYDKTSRDLLEATSSLLAGRSTTTSGTGKNTQNLQHSYNMVTSLVSHQFGPRLYQDLVKELQASAKAVLPEQAGRASSDLLPFLAQQYPKYVDHLLLVRHVCMGLDRPYVWEDGAVVKRTCQSTTLLEVGLQQFHARLRDMGWEDDAYEAWWHLFWDESFAKNNDSSNAETSSSFLSLLASTMNMWKDLGMSRSMIQRTQPLLQRSLQQLSTTWQGGEYSPQAFLMYVYQQWQYVSQHCSTFLPKTWLRSLIEMNLLEPHLNAQYLLKELDITNLQHCQRLWYLSARIDGGLQRVLTAVCALVKKQGLACIQPEQQKQPQQQPPAPQQQQPKVIISSLLLLYAQLQALQKTVGDIPLKQVWSEVLNSTPLVAEWLAKYIDMEFKNYNTTKGGASETSLTSAGNSNNLDPLLHLFTHLQAKDVFEAFYKKDLAKRLLLGRIQNMDLERQFVSLLKTECGAGYTSKMEGMFQDMEWSRESLARFKDSAEYQPTAVDMEVQILTTGYWPVYAQYKNLVLPDELTTPQQHFWDHYKQKYQGRKIVWQYALGNCHVKYQGAKKVHELVVSLCQTLVLQCFNERDRWTPPELMQRIGLDDRDEMERTLMSMALGKDQYKILSRKRGPSNAAAAAAGDPSAKPVGKPIADDDIFFINEKFSSNLRRIKIPNMLKKETKEERDKVVEAVSRDRLYLIDAVLVRIMKARKTILHQQLIPQVLEQVKVPAQPADIKKRIESLIEREYMERDEKERSRYNYLA